MRGVEQQINILSCCNSGDNCFGSCNSVDSGFGCGSSSVCGQDTSKNDFGQKASEDLAKDGEMGQHSSDPSGDGTSNPDPRSGIGNVFNPGDPKDSDLSKHPSDTINELCRLDPNNDACNPNP